REAGQNDEPLCSQAYGERLRNLVMPGSEADTTCAQRVSERVADRCERGGLDRRNYFRTRRRDSLYQIAAADRPIRVVQNLDQLWRRRREVLALIEVRLRVIEQIRGAISQELS